MAPSQQNASGIGGELQLTSRNYALAVGFTPYDFLVGNVIGRGQFRTFKGRLTFYGERESVKDTQLSYAGMRDPRLRDSILHWQHLGWRRFHWRRRPASTSADPGPASTSPVMLPI